ncbi:hypothetical protein [Actinopolymorpha sp. B9G3]|uniref:hypothetical protein n=1 Tax=Actinopolymorpha sp. B9G3 TaxID=3158970 RepID=UPI0032D918D2
MPDRRGRLHRRAVSTLSRRAVAALSAGVCVAIAALAVTAIVLARPAGEDASIDGYTVTRDELLFHLRRLEPTVQNELRNEHRLQGAIDWTTPVGDGTALDQLTSRALDEIWRDKTTLILAEERGLGVAIDHEDFLAQLADENERRADALARGEVVYGVTAFSPEEYYSHRLTEITTALKERLSAAAGDPLWVDDGDVRRAFDADREAWSANATTYSYSKLVVRVPEGDGASTDYAARLNRRVAAAGRLADVAAREPGATLTTDTYDGGLAGANAHDQDLMTLLGDLAPGEISAPVMGTGQVTYYELDGRSVDESAALADYSRRIRQVLIEERFKQFLERRIATSDIEVDAEALDAINAKDVQE